MRIRPLLLLSIFAVSLGAHAAASQEDAEALVKVEQQWIAAANAGDVATLNAIVDETYKADTPRGIVDRAQTVMPSGSGVTQTLRNLSAKVDGDRGTVSGENRVTLSSGGIVNLQFVDSFVRKDGKWVVVHSYVTEN
ncbi:hypothetical protein AWB71_04752 [Caballeronia peredens]|nr:hypothetical protein AWB71_04752 [Caballeronia peredens]